MQYGFFHLRNLFFLFFFQAVSCLSLHGQTLTLYTFPPPRPYKWKNPHSLLVSTVRNYYSKTRIHQRRILGHMVIELRKDSTVFLTGMALDDMGGFRKSIFNDKIGLGVLFKLAPGHLEETHHVEKELTSRIESSNAAFITFKLTDSAYNYLIAYIDSFKLMGYDKLYNGLNMPRAGKGSGCTAFGISFLELINALVPEFRDHWAINVNIPERLIGDSASAKKVSFWRILFSFRWARQGQPHRKLTLYEPYLIYKWINTVWEKGQDNPNTGYQCMQTGSIRGLEVDYRHQFVISPMFVK